MLHQLLCIQSARAICLYVIFTLGILTRDSVAETCDVARGKCHFRDGCGLALRNYMFECADVMAGRTGRCTDGCSRSLIALTSTEEGQLLVVCDCQDEEFCLQSKERVEICRDKVTSAMGKTAIVSCSVAHWICNVDPLCNTALEYYHRFCRPMIHGRKCTSRCKNSIAILNRQEKAAKLRTCVCDGNEEYNCQQIKENMDHLCFKKRNLMKNTQVLTTTKTSQVVTACSTRCYLNINLFIIYVAFYLYKNKIIV